MLSIAFLSIMLSVIMLYVIMLNVMEGINCKQSTRWQHLSWLKASAFFSLQKILVVMKHNNLYLGLVLPSGGWQSRIMLSVIGVSLSVTFILV
jgi:hypothetical protein